MRQKQKKELWTLLRAQINEPSSGLFHIQLTYCSSSAAYYWYHFLFVCVHEHLTSTNTNQRLCCLPAVAVKFTTFSKSMERQQKALNTHIHPHTHTRKVFQLSSLWLLLFLIRIKHWRHCTDRNRQQVIDAAAFSGGKKTQMNPWENRSIYRLCH